MATETRKPVDKMQMPQMPEFLGGMWDATMKAQRQWFGFCTQPFGFAPAPEKAFKRWHMLNNEWLKHTEKSVDRMKDFVTDEVKLVRDFTDKTFEMAKELDKTETPVVKPEFTREWFDTSRRCLERTFEFNTQTMKAFEELGFMCSEMMMKEPMKAS